MVIDRHIVSNPKCSHSYAKYVRRLGNITDISPCIITPHLLIFLMSPRLTFLKPNRCYNSIEMWVAQMYNNQSQIPFLKFFANYLLPKLKTSQSYFFLGTSISNFSSNLENCHNYSFFFFFLVPIPPSVMEFQIIHFWISSNGLLTHSLLNQTGCLRSFPDPIISLSLLNLSSMNQHRAHH